MYATGETKDPPLRVTFDRRLKLARITSGGSLLAYRELDDALDEGQRCTERL